MTAGGFMWLQKNQSNRQKSWLETRFHPYPRPYAWWPTLRDALAQEHFIQTQLPTVTAPMWPQTPTRSPALGQATATPVPKPSVTQPRPSPLSLGHHSPQWPLCEAALVHTMWDCQPPQSTGPLLPLTPQQGNDWETRGPNKCPFVIPAWKLWRQHKLILVSKVAQTIAWMPPG